MDGSQTVSRHYVNGLCLVTRSDGSLVHYYKFKFKGETYHGSTDEADPYEARAFLEALRTELRDKAKKGEHSRLSLPTLSKVHGDWLGLANTLFSERHRKSFDSYWRRHIEPDLGHIPLNLISTKLVEKVRAKYIEGGGTSGGSNSLLKVLRTLLSFAIRRGDISRLPYEVSKLQVQRKPRPVLPAQAVERFLGAIDRSRNPNVSGIIRLMLGLGLRENEALNARWENLDLDRKTYQPAKTKSGKAPVLPVPDWLAAFLVKLKGENTLGWIFLAEDGNPHRVGYTRKAIERAGGKVGLVNLTPHRLRATFATLHVEAGTALPKVQQMLGHSDISTTMRYVEDSTEGLREAQARVAEVMGLGVASKSARKPKGKTTGGTIGGMIKKKTRKKSRQVKQVQH